MTEMQCLVCGNKKFRLFHEGTRDNPEINVMQCSKCKSLQLSAFSQIDNNYYENGTMRKNQYDAASDAYMDTLWENWRRETREDDLRRLQMLRELMRGKTNILDFGCGNGGFLSALQEEDIVSDVVGIELDTEARSRMRAEGITVYEDLDDIDTNVRFDVITMFHVIEHLSDPDAILRKLRDKLADGGLLIVETPNADDALISKYHSQSFMDFTFWSAHLFLYNSGSLEMLMHRNDFSTVQNGQVQRYPLGNHLYWLAEGKPGGVKRWNEFNNDTIQRAYSDILKEMGICDTLFGIFKK